MIKVESKRAEEVGNAIYDALKKLKIHTLTLDNGKEFSDHENVAKKLNAKIYFAHPYCSHERGLNENTNGLIRQYFPKKVTLLNSLIKTL
jgi:IS30 family transposase